MMIGCEFHVMPVIIFLLLVFEAHVNTLFRNKVNVLFLMN